MREQKPSPLSQYKDYRCSECGGKRLVFSVKGRFMHCIDCYEWGHTGGFPQPPKDR